MQKTVIFSRIAFTPEQREISDSSIQSCHGGIGAHQAGFKLHLGMMTTKAVLPRLDDRSHVPIAPDAQSVGRGRPRNEAVRRSLAARSDGERSGAKDG